MEHILNLEQVKKYYGGNSGNITKAVDGISMYVDKGEFVAIMGASGSGKTTLLNCISTNILLVIEDNGCGIKASDLSRVFEKGFTGSNRNKANATGMGLYLSKKLCDRLGLKLDIASTEKEYTRLTITCSSKGSKKERHNNIYTFMYRICFSFRILEQST